MLAFAGATVAPPRSGVRSLILCLVRPVPRLVTRSRQKPTEMSDVPQSPSSNILMTVQDRMVAAGILSNRVSPALKRWASSEDQVPLWLFR